MVFTALRSNCIDSLKDERWDTIRQREKECHQYLQESSEFMFNILTSEDSQRANTSDTKDAPRPTPIYVLPKQLARFYGRENDLKAISTSLTERSSVTLRGIAGVGKTSVALHFAYQSLSDYSVILWMRCEPMTALDQSCQEALRRLGVIAEGRNQVIESRQIWRDYLAQACQFSVTLPRVLILMGVSSLPVACDI